MAGGGAEREKEHLLASWLLDGPQLFQPPWGVKEPLGCFSPMDVTWNRRTTQLNPA